MHLRGVRFFWLSFIFYTLHCKDLGWKVGVGKIDRVGLRRQ